jgi:hypothetical protein
MVTEFLLFTRDRRLGQHTLDSTSREETELWPRLLTEPKSLKYFELSEASGGRTTAEASAEIFTGSQARAGAELLAVEEPL